MIHFFTWKMLYLKLLFNLLCQLIHFIINIALHLLDFINLTKFAPTIILNRHQVELYYYSLQLFNFRYYFIGLKYYFFLFIISMLFHL